MTTIAFLIFFISLMDSTFFSPTFQTDYDFKNFEVMEETNTFVTEIWTEYSKLLAVQKSDVFCEGNTDIIFPDTFTKNLYYRCQSGNKELYQCIEGFEFDHSRLRCFPQNIRLNNTLVFSECFYQMDGLYPDYQSSCQKYFRCKNGIKVEMLSCSSQQSFSFHLQTCQLKSENTCVPSNCQADNDDFYVLPGSKCQAYYYCRRGIRSDFLCPKGSFFNRLTRTCVESGICYEPVCTGRIDGRYPDTTHDCIRSFDCKGGVIDQVNSCSTGQQYNGYMCVFPPFKNCEEPEKTAAAFYFGVNDECKILHDGKYMVPGTDCRNVRFCLRGKTTAVFECPKNQRFNGIGCFPKHAIPCDDMCFMKADGYYADDFTNCESYFSCLNGKVLKRKLCSVGTAFNGFMCIPSYLVSCPQNSRPFIGRCLGLRNGFHPDYLNSCRNYFYCYNHEIIQQGSCTEGMIWHEKYCTTKNESICEGPKKLEECNGLFPGLYQNKTSGCTKYFYCNSGSGTILSCPTGQIFNGDKCINADEYTCLNSNDCFNQSDGYRQDKNTGCRSYYYCSNGNKITYVCSDGFIFNGSNCVPFQTYQCPFSSSKDCIGKHNGYYPDISSGCRKYFYCFKEEKLTTLSCGGKKIFNGRGCVLVENPYTVCHDIKNTLCNQKQDGIYINSDSECKK